jgi:hypothetical protein
MLWQAGQHLQQTMLPTLKQQRQQLHQRQC